MMLVAVGSWAAGQDKYTLQVPNGLPFSDFKGYEDWQVVAVSQTDALLKVMVANPTMIAAYKAGIPGNGKSFPDGSKIAKNRVEAKEEHGGAVRREDSREFAGRFLHREGQQAISEHQRLGIRRL